MSSLARFPPLLTSRPPPPPSAFFSNTAASWIGKSSASDASRSSIRDASKYYSTVSVLLVAARWRTLTTRRRRGRFNRSELVHRRFLAAAPFCSLFSSIRFIPASPFLPSFLVHALFSPLYDHDPFNALFFASSLSLPLISSLHTPLSRDRSYEHSECVPNTEKIGGVLGARGGERENEDGPVASSLCSTFPLFHFCLLRQNFVSSILRS